MEPRSSVGISPEHPETPADQMPPGGAAAAARSLPLDIQLPAPQPLWLTAVATLAEVGLPAAVAIGAVVLLAPPLTPTGHHPGVAVTVSVLLALGAGLGTAQLAATAWRRTAALPGAGPSEHLPQRWLRHRQAHRRMSQLVRQLGEQPPAPSQDSLDMVLDLCRALARRDPYTRAHSGRVSRLSESLGRQVGLSKDECEVARLAALMHDIGKLGIPPSILNKPGPLDSYETGLVAQHTVIGAALVAPIAGPDVARAIRHHHERMDGGGYPDGISAEAIPTIARLVAVADTYDALVSDRAYRPARSRVEAFAVLRDVAGTQLDATFVEILIEMESARVPLGAWGAFGPILLPLGALLRRTRHLVNVSPVPAAAATTALVLGASSLGLVPGLALAPAVVAARAPRHAASAALTLPAPDPSPAGITDTAVVPVTTTATSPVATSAAHGARLASGARPAPSPSAKGLATQILSAVTGPVTPAPVLSPVVNQGGLPPALTAPARNLNSLLASLDGVASDNNLSVSLTSGAGGDLLVAFVAADGPAAGTQSVAAISGGGTDWTPVLAANGGGGTAEVWTAHASGRLTGEKVSVTLAVGDGSFGGALTVLAMAPSARVAARAGGAGLTGAAAVALTTTVAGSAILAVGHDNSHTVPHIPLAGQTVVHENLGPATDTNWLQSAGPVAAAGSTVVVGDVAPVANPWDLVAVEITP